MAEVTFIGAAAINDRVRAAAVRALTDSAEHLVGEQMAAAPVKTGTLRASIHIDAVDDAGDTLTAVTATGGESSAYAVFVHEGTGAHVIRAKDGGWLSWPGASHPVKEVHHPGTAANKFMEGPLIANVPYYEAAAARALSAI